eukprot:CAMPEP_0113534104 /NCGR_PEP_ID=MMETSP0015_2-20120614/4979_1 /TAXON_ID=2838 /ORGANISM="Odontella" /LENGTH=171 /DNA_ID=CAMNT_0000433239 /DNA_START=56 /DNA_END=571 /DNA_ORIENTATION=- /assembly_acc=CAM_ASM_000160
MSSAVPPSDDAEGDEQTIRLRVAGLGHDVQFSLPPTASVRDVKSRVAADTPLPSQYVLLLCRGKKLTDDDATLAELGIKDRTRLMLLHGPEYGRDKVGVEKLQVVLNELKDLERNDAVEPKVIDEMVTRACIKLDGIDVSGSDALRALRKDTLKRAEDLAAKRGAAHSAGD